MMLQADKPDDYVIATGEAHSVREFVELAFGHTGVAICWEGSGIEEKGLDDKTGRVLVEVDPRYFRPTEVEHLLGDPSKAKRILGWTPKVRFTELVAMMLQADIEEAKKELHLKEGGFRVSKRNE